MKCDICSSTGLSHAAENSDLTFHTILRQLRAPARWSLTSHHFYIDIASIANTLHEQASPFGATPRTAQLRPARHASLQDAAVCLVSTISRHAATG